MDKRALPGLTVGVLGGVLGGLGALTGHRVLALAAGLAALGAGAATAVISAGLRRAQTRLTASAGTYEHAREQAQAADARADALEAALQQAEMALAEAEDSREDANRGPESVFDAETGLLDERVFVVSFERKVAAARRHLRPLCLVLLDLGSGLPVEVPARAQVLARFGAVVRETLRDADIACRLGPTTFGLILEDTPEAGGVWAAERLQIAVACDRRSPTRVAASVATYPNHGLVAQEVLQRGQEALTRARGAGSDGMGPVEVATSDLS